MTTVVQPSGSVTLVFTDIEGSTKLLEKLGSSAYKEALAEHRLVVRAACARHSGYEVDYEGDAFFYAFASARDAVSAVSDAMRGLQDGPISIRVGIHTGEPELDPPKYVGLDVHRAARIMSSAHGGQVVLSPSTVSLLEPGEFDVRALGQHRLKDLSAPIAVSQLVLEGLPSEFPPLKTLHQTNLPIPQTPFVGREKELGEVLTLTEREDVRLLTMTGPGGTGKTRLAAQAAGAIAGRFPHGVWWVPLAPLRDPELVLESASQVVGAKNGLVAHIADKQMLLLFDNFEHVVEAASGISELLGECPYLELLVTSREPLHLAGEHEYPVPPFVTEEAVGFFASRARTVQPDFKVDEAVPEICQRLDELPLALELAASRVKALSTAQILARLEQRLPLLTGGTRDAPERQRTLRATIEWSYDLLSAEEQELFRRLSVFAGGCTLEAAEEVCEADLDTLQSLVEKSLLRFTDGRYWMLETIREYAGAVLADSGDADHLRRLHADFFRGVTENAESELQGPTGADTFQRLEREIDNVRSAIGWAIGNDRTLALALVSSLWYFWGTSGRASEGRRLSEASWTDAAPPAERLRALRAMSANALSQSDHEDVISLSLARLDLARESGDTGHEVGASTNLGSAYRIAGDSTAARRWFSDAINMARQHGDDQLLLGPSLVNLASLEREDGDFARSREHLDEVLALSKAGGHELLYCWALKELGLTATEEEVFDEARALFAEALEIASRVGTPDYEASLVFAVSILESKTGRPRESAILAGAGEATYKAHGEKILPSMTWFHALRDRLRDALGDSDYEKLTAEGRSLEHEAAVGLARSCLDRRL